MFVVSNAVLQDSSVGTICLLRRKDFVDLLVSKRMVFILACPIRPLGPLSFALKSIQGPGSRRLFLVRFKMSVSCGLETN